MIFQWNSKSNEINEIFSQCMKELSDSFYCEIDLLQNVGLTNPDIQIQVLPELSGNKMAAIGSYGAVGMSGDYKEEAYDILTRFLYREKQDNPDASG